MERKHDCPCLFLVYLALVRVLCFPCPVEKQSWYMQPPPLCKARNHLNNTINQLCIALRLRGGYFPSYFRAPALDKGNNKKRPILAKSRRLVVEE